MRTGTNARLTYVWLVLSAVTVLSWWLGRTAHAHGHRVPDARIVVVIVGETFRATIC